MIHRAKSQRNIIVLDLQGGSSESELPNSRGSIYASIARTVLIFGFGLLAVEVLQYLVSEMILLRY